MTEESPAPERHLYEFAEGGFYVATSQDEAFGFYDEDAGEPGLAGEYFRRQVPDDEEVEVLGEDPHEMWGDPREYLAPTKLGSHWALKVTAREWANTDLTHGQGCVFGGDS